MLNKASKSVKSFRIALIVPVVITLLALIPDIRICFEWLELKFTDTLFTFYPQLCFITGNKLQYNSPAAIITKDQTFQTKFGKSPTRKDFSKLLDSLKQQGVKIAALDFIYDEPTNNEDDNAFIKSLDDFPYPILAHNFVGRGQQSFSIVDYNDKTSDRPTWPISLYKPIADKAAARGLINVPSGLDSTIREVPLAFHPSDSNRFLPTLGFSAWIGNLLCEKEIIINRIDLSKANSINDAMNMVYASAPYRFNSVGHKGLDKSITELESLYIYRHIIKYYPNLKPADNQLSVETITSHASIKEKTWVKLPSKPLPLIGTYNTPCIRIPYKKLAAPLKGDGIETISMARLLETEEEANSSYLFSKNKVSFNSENKNTNLKITGPNSKAGIYSTKGSIITVTGKPVSNAKVFAIQPQTGFWQKSYSDEKGNFVLNNLPAGNYVINVFISENNGWEKASLSFEVKEDSQILPLLLLSDNINSIQIPSTICQSNSESDLWIHGEIIPMLHSNSDGVCSATAIPEGYSIISLNDDEDAPEESFSLDGNGKLLSNGQTSYNTTVAVMPDDESWNLHYYRKISLNSDKNIIVENIPTSLDSSISLTNESTENIVPSKEEIILKPGTPTIINTLPKAYKDKKNTINLTIDFVNIHAVGNKALLLSDSGEECEINDKETQIINCGSYIILTEALGLKGLYKPVLLDKRTVFVGTSMATDQDFIVSPINFLDQSFSHMPGVNVHANLFTALSNQELFYPLPFHMDKAPNTWPFWQFLLILPVLVILSIRFKNAESLKTSFIVLIIIFAIVATSIYLFPSRILLPTVFPAVLILSFGITRGAIEWINSRRLADETKSAFSRFISADVVSQIIKNPDAIKPGGEKKELSIIFTDIAGFTSISEKLEPEALTILMNNYLNEMTKILFKYGGTLDKYIGDAIMGFWNHPTIQEDHATRAVSCAIDMQKKLRELRDEWMAQGLPKVECRAGINSGNCMVGFIGSDAQMNFTCLGDNVNLASRLEGANKAYGTYIMITETVRQQLNPYLFSVRFLDFLAVKGKDQPVLVYEVRGWLKDEKEDWKTKASKLYQQGIDNYLARKWDDAINNFNEVIKTMGEDSPSLVYIERCEKFKIDPPPEKWDGRYILKTK